jgi:hypothetical protein
MKCSSWKEMDSPKMFLFKLGGRRSNLYVRKYLKEGERSDTRERVRGESRRRQDRM